MISTRAFSSLLFAGRDQWNRRFPDRLDARSGLDDVGHKRLFFLHRNRLLDYVFKRVRLIIRTDRSDPATAAAISEQ